MRGGPGGAPGGAGGFGGEGGPGMPGMRGGRAGGSNADPNGPEAAVDAFLNAVAAKDKESLTKMVSSKATGDLARMRKGDLDDRAITKISETYARLNIIRVAAVTKGDERVVVLGTGQAGDSNKKVAGAKQVVLRKEDGAWKVFSVSK
jgi:hypothetical protein